MNYTPEQLAQMAAYKRLQRERSRAKGAAQLTIVLGKEAAQALITLAKGTTKTDAITRLLLEAAAKRRAARTSARPKRAAGRG